MLSRAIKVDKKMTARVQFTANNTANTSLVLTLEYVPPRIFEEEQNRAKLKILGNRNSNPLQDLLEEQRQTMQAYFMLLAARVRRIDDGAQEDDGGVTIAKLYQLVPLDDDMIRQWGGMKARISFNTQDATPLTPEDKSKYGYDEKVNTRGEAALINIASLLGANHALTDFVTRACTDVSLYQNGTDFEAELKNS